MPLINCPECHGTVSDQASQCPHCGHPLTAVGRPPAPPSSPRPQTPPPVATRSSTKRIIVTVFVIVSGLFGLFLSARSVVFDWYRVPALSRS